MDGRYRRGRGGGGYRGDGYRGRGRGGHSHHSGHGELWDTRDAAPHRIVVADPHQHQEPPTPPVAAAAAAPPLRIQTRTATSGQQSGHAKWLRQEESLPCHKLLDDGLVWNEHAAEMLQGQSNFLVVGVLGKQSAGKSTVMSLLAGTRPEQILSKAKPFPVAPTAALEINSHQTYGIDISVTTERVILLDTQPMFSLSVLDRLLLHDRHSQGESDSMEHYRLQSYQIAAFLFQVCHVVIIVQDSSSYDFEMCHVLGMAEMLRPTLGSGQNEASASQGAPAVRAPHVVTVFNKMSPEDFLASNVRALHNITEHMLKHSNTRHHGGMSTLQSGLVLCEERQRSGPTSKVNLFLLPSISTAVTGAFSTGSRALSSMSVAAAPAPAMRGYSGRPSFGSASNALVREVLSIQPGKLTPSSAPMSELQWFTFACRVWEAIRRSSLSADLVSLLSE